VQVLQDPFEQPNWQDWMVESFLQLPALWQEITLLP
jgi:hypothetical protein